MNRRGRHAIPPRSATPAVREQIGARAPGSRATRMVIVTATATATSHICVWALASPILLALNTMIRPNWTIGAPVKRSLIAYDH
jgi:hypothetical protein